MNGLFLGVLVALLPTEGLESEARVSVRWSLLMNMDTEDARAMEQGVGSALDSWRARPIFDRVDADCVARPACVTTSFMRAGADEEWMLSVVRLGEDVRVEGLRTRSVEGQIVSNPIAPFVVTRGSLEAPESWMAPAPERSAPDTIVPEEDPLAVVRQARPRRPIQLGTWIAAGVAAAALGVGIGFGVSAASLESGLEADGCASHPCGTNRIDRLEDHALAADVSYGLAGGAAATAFVMFLLRPTKR